MSIRYLALSVAFLTTQVQAADPFAAGRRIVEQGTAHATPPCTSCHGQDLRGGMAVGPPSIAGRQADFIVARLDHYASPEGHNPMMKQVATSLTQERSDVARFIQTLPLGWSKQ